LAVELVKAQGFGMQSGRYRSHPAAGDAARVRAEVRRRLGDVEAVRDGADDALSGRRPRW
jgi:hypothetical protein